MSKQEFALWIRTFTLKIMNVKFWLYLTYLIEQKGMNFDHDFDYFFPLFSSLLKKEERRKENE